MKYFPRLAFVLAAVSSMSNADEQHVLLAGTTITASFESKMAMKGHRIGGPELLQVHGGIKCKIIASTGLRDDGLDEIKGGGSSVGPFRTMVGTVTPQLLVCASGRKSIPVTDHILPARTAIGDKAPEQVEFIVAKPLSL